MSDKKFQIIIDCGSSKIRAGAFNGESKNNPFFIESNFYTEQFNLKLDIQKIIASLEKSTNEYIDNIEDRYICQKMKRMRWKIKIMML